MKQETLLQLQNVSVHYGGVKALDGVDIEIDEGEVVALMGPNGAGKSTVLKAIFGLVTLDGGSVCWHEKPIVPMPHHMVERGITFVPQGRRVFSHLTVEENLEMGGFTVRDKRELARRTEEVIETFPKLKQKRAMRSGALSGGEQQMLALARGLMTDPKVLLLDEPSLGLAPKIVREVFEAIQDINKRHGTAVLIVEHNLVSLLTIAGRGYILDKGRVVAASSSEKLRGGDVLEKILLGA